MRSSVIDHFDASAVFRGLLHGAEYRNRVADSCIYCCPRCAHRIRFRWRSFYQADGVSRFKRRTKRAFDDLTPSLECAEQGCFDFHCPSCSASTRIIFSAHETSELAYHFDIYAALVGKGKRLA